MNLINRHLKTNNQRQLKSSIEFEDLERIQLSKYFLRVTSKVLSFF